MPFEGAALRIQKACYAYRDGFAVRDVDLSISPGELVGLLGPNGSGKTTLIKLASGVLVPQTGEISLDGVSMRKLSRKQVAQRVAVVPQQFSIPFAFKVNEVVLLGRTPFVRAIAGETEQDRRITAGALEATGMVPFRDRQFNELSGGERQKAILAMALAQQPELILLDEPTAHLDINHQTEILELLQELNREQGVTVFAAIHDLNLAALYFDRLVLLDGGKVFADGPPSTVITKETVQQVFSATVEVGRHPQSPVPHIVVLPKNGHSN